MLKPLFKWAGSKQRLLPKYQLNPGIPLQKYDAVIEPFFGSGAFTQFMYNNTTNDRYIISDINAEIINLYATIKTDVDSFIHSVLSYQDQYLPLGYEERKKFYYSLRQQYIEKKTVCDTASAALLFFLMKTSFNGIWQTTKEAKGRFATPCGLLNEKSNIIDVEVIQHWNVFLQKCKILNETWENVLTPDIKNTLIFLDPPYRGSFTTYETVFNDDDFLRLYQHAVRLSQNNTVMLCNREIGDGFFDNMTSLSKTYYRTTYTAGRRQKDDGVFTAKKAVEVLFHNITHYNTFSAKCINKYK